MKQEKNNSQIQLKITKINKDHYNNEAKYEELVLCGGDDVCSWWDGYCNPKYH